MAPSAISTDPVSQLENESAVLIQAATADIKSNPHFEPVKPSVEPITTEIDCGDSTETSSAVDGFIDTPPSGPVDKKAEDSKAQTTRWLSLNEVVPSVSKPLSGAKKLRKMLFETDELIICPGVYDGLSARTAIELGFNAMYMVRNGNPSLHGPHVAKRLSSAGLSANACFP